MSLPKGWADAAIADFTATKVEQGEPTERVRYVDISAIDRDRKVVGTVDEVDAKTAPTRARQWIQTGDVLVSMTRPNLNAVALVPPELAGSVASTGFDVLRSHGVLPEWLFARVRSREFIVDICRDVQGVVYPAVRPDDVRRHRMPIAPLEEQRRIVEALDSYLSRLDAAVENLERAQAKLKAYRASVLKAAVEGRLVPTEAELARQENRDYEPAQVLLDRILKERRRRWEETELARLKKAGKTPKDDKWKAKYSEPIPPDTCGLPDLPEGWCWGSLGLFKEFSLYGPRFSSADYADDGVLVLRTSDISEGGRVDLESPPRLRLSGEEFGSYRVQRGDLLVTRTGSLGTLAVLDDDVRAIAGAYLIQYRLAAPLEMIWYCFYALKSPEGQAHLKGRGQGIGRPNLNAPTIDSIPIALPPLAEQVRTTEAIQQLLSICSRIEIETAANVLRCGRLRQAVLKWAFQGMLVDQEPNDEPAEQLLARIRAERAAATPVKKSRAKKTARKKS